MLTKRSIKSLALLAVAVCTACVQQHSRATDKVAAAVGNQKLYESELQSLAGPDSGADSMTIVNAYMDKWLKRAAVIDEAERTLSTTIDVEKLVEDYRASLLLSNYRQQIVQARLDTAITQEELESEYEVQRQNFMLAEPIIQARLAKVERNKPSLREFMTDWRKNNLVEVEAYCEAYSDIYDLGGEWKAVQKLKELLPEGLLDDSAWLKKGSTQKYASGYEYFVKILDVVDEGEVPPLSYVEDKIRDIIIHKRKNRLIAKLEQDIYTKALATKKVRVYKK